MILRIKRLQKRLRPGRSVAPNAWAAARWVGNVPAKGLREIADLGAASATGAARDLTGELTLDAA
ncbi:hypothetical protein [Marinovum sp.]|uniref:hypothetical protein n=1 Tax=Marinovum sp. TaxID=2024839 RepID=UPI002B26DAEF|nr:hypothetical protein [Marinovum sp.]